MPCYLASPAMAGALRQPLDQQAELLCEAGDTETGPDTELLPGSGGSFRSSCRQACRTAGQARWRLRLGAATGLVTLACTLVVASNRVVSGPARSSSLSGSSIRLEAEPSGGGQRGCNSAVDEEYFGGLCYKKCSYLTRGDYTIRTSAMTCCRSHPCGLFNQRHDMGLCSGFSVAGGKTGACPHTPGCCLPDEEMLLGQCYKQCELLTNGSYPYRVAPGTCCDRDSELLCLVPKTGYSVTGAKYDVGGGDGSEAAFHAPLREVDKRMVAKLTTASPLRDSAATEQMVVVSVTQPVLPDWYKDMQADKETTGARAAQADILDSPTAPPVPSWAKEGYSGSTTAAPATSPPATPAPVTAPAPAPTPAELPSALEPAPAEPAAAPPAMAPPAPQPAPKVDQQMPTEQPTRPPAQGTTMPAWLQEIVAKPKPADGEGKHPARPAAPAAPAAPPAPAATTAPPVAASPADPTATTAAASAASAVPAALAAHATHAAHAAAAAGGKAHKMPDWASDMLSYQESPGSREQDAAPAAPSAPASDGGGRGVPPVPSWAQGYVARAE